MGVVSVVSSFSTIITLWVSSVAAGSESSAGTLAWEVSMIMTAASSSDEERI